MVCDAFDLGGTTESSVGERVAGKKIDQIRCLCFGASYDTNRGISSTLGKRSIQVVQLPIAEVWIRNGALKPSHYIG